MCSYRWGMMTWLLVGLLLVAGVSASGGGPTSGPTSRPVRLLCGGELRYVPPPAPWQEKSKGEDDLRV